MWFLGVIRQIFAFIDTVAFGLVDQAYNLIDEFSKAHFFDGEVVTQVRNNLYVIIGIFALFRIALILVNSIINPDKLNEKGNGVGNVLINLLVMFVLLVATPLIFNEALDLQEKIVSGNYIQKMFLDPGSLEKLENPGKMMQSVAISSLITLNDDVVVDGTCTGECQDAVEEYEEMRKTGFTMPRIALYVDNKGTGSDGEKAFVYDYMILVTFAAGLFITYTLFKFAIDIAIRMVKLTALQILAPLFIATYIDPKYAKSGPFNNWLKEVGKTYISLFTRLAIVSIMLLLLALVDKVDLSGGIPKLLLLIAVLIFAKEAPKWIANLIGVSDDGLSGGILKKLGSAALIGGAITKGANALMGGGMNAVRTAHAARKAHKNNLKNEGERAFSKARKNYNDNKSSGKFSAFGNAVKGSYFSKKGIKDNLKNFGTTAAAGGAGFLKGAFEGTKIGFGAADIKDINAKTKANAKQTLENYSPGYKTRTEKLGQFLGAATDKPMDAILGDAYARDERKKEAEGIEKAKSRYGKVEFDSEGKRNTAACPVSSKDVNAAIKDINNRGKIGADGNQIKLDGASLDGISGALIQARLDSGSLSGVQLTSGGTQVIDSNGNKYSTSQFCQENGIYNPYGKAELEVISKEIAYTKASEYVNNQGKISEANQAAALANTQIYEMSGRITADLGDASKNIFATMNTMLNEQLAATRALNEAMVSGTKTPQEISDLKDAVEKAQNRVNTAITNSRNAEGMDLGALDSYLAAIKTRADAIDTMTILSAQNEKTKMEIEHSITVDGDKSNYHVTDKITGETFDFLSDPTKNEYAITLLERAKNSASDDAKKLAPKKDDK